MLFPIKWDAQLISFSRFVLTFLTLALRVYKCYSCSELYIYSCLAKTNHFSLIGLNQNSISSIRKIFFKIIQFMLVYGSFYSFWTEYLKKNNG